MLEQIRVLNMKLFWYISRTAFGIIMLPFFCSCVILVLPFNAYMDWLLGENKDPNVQSIILSDFWSIFKWIRS